MRLSQLSVLCIVLLLAGCSVTRLQKAGNTAPEEFYLKTNFEIYKGIVALDMTRDGTPGKYLFDTGADLSLIQRDTVIGRQSKYSGASKRKMRLGRERVASLAIGNIEFKKTRALNGDMVGLKEQIPNFGGLIGQPVIQKANWLINYPEKILEMSSYGLSDSTFTEIKIERRNGNNPYTYLTFNGKSYRVVIDLGSSSMLNLPDDSEFAKEVTKAIDLFDHTRDRYTLGGLQNITEKIGVIPEITLGDFELEDVKVNINTSSQPRIGSRFFEQFLVCIDNSEGGRYLLKRADPNEPRPTVGGD
ncbi:MAG: pepsin/retropepsin-like aspartic protease family protein [Bacteroidota bacterium]